MSFEQGHELLADFLVHDEALGGNAALAAINHAALGGGLGRQGQVGIGQHDERVRAAQLQYGFLDVLAGSGGDGRARALRAGQGHGHQAVVGNQLFNLVGPHQQGAETGGWQASIVQYFLQGQGALRHVGGVLEQTHVAGHQGRGGEAHYLPEGEVPGHHGQHHAQRLIADEAAAGIGFHQLVGQKSFGVLGIVLAAGRALQHLSPAVGDGFAHFQGHEAGQGILALAQQGGGAAQYAGAVGKGGGGPGGRGPVRLAQQALGFGPGERGKAPQHPPGVRVERFNGHNSVRKVKKRQLRHRLDGDVSLKEVVRKISRSKTGNGAM